jgi:hypothetical protein
MIDLAQIDEVNLRNYDIDRIAANSLAKLGAFKAIDIRGGPENSMLNIEEEESKCLSKIESRIEKRWNVSEEEAKTVVLHLEKIVEIGESDGMLKDIDGMVKESKKYCEEEGISGGLAEKLALYTEFLAFGYRYKVEGGLPEDESGSEPSAQEKKARKRAEAVESNSGNGITDAVRNLIGI